MYKNRKLILLPFFILILFFYGCKAKEEPKKEPIKVVAVMSLSGEAKNLGQSSKNGLELLSKEFSKKGVEIIYLDDENNKEKAEGYLKAIIAKEKIKAIILCSQSNCAETVAKIAADNEIITINATATDTESSKIGKDFIYSLCLSNEVEGNALSKFTYEKLKFSSASILYNEEESYSKNLAEYFKVNFEKLGGKVNTIASYKNNTENYTEALKKIKDSGSDVLFIPDYYYKVSNIVKQIKDLEINTVLMGGDGFDCGDLLDKKEFQDSYFLSQFVAKDSIPGTIEFKKQYEDAFKAIPNSKAALAYDAGKIIISAFEDSSRGENTVKIKQILGKTEMEGVSGNISFSQDKRAKKISYIVQIKDNSLQIVNKAIP